MSSLERLLGRESISIEVITALNSADDAILRLTGDPGSGKTTTALEIGAAWAESGAVSLVVSGDDRNASRELFPFLNGITPVTRHWLSLAGQGSHSALKAVDALAGTGGIAGSIFDLLTSALRQKFERAVRPLTALEKEIVLDLKRQLRAKPALLIVDNAHWLDRQSLELLHHLRSSSLRDAIPEIGKLRLMLVDTADDQPPICPESFNSLVRDAATKEWRLRRCTKEQFAAVLQTLGLKVALPQEVVDALYAATGGHLKLCEQIVAYINEHGTSALADATTGLELLSNLIGQRFSTLGSRGEELAGILAKAAVIGIRFDRSQLSCMLDMPMSQLDAALKRAQELSLIRVDLASPQFSHDIVRTHFISAMSSTQLRTLQSRLAKCLAIVRPADYQARYVLLSSAGEEQAARDMLGLAMVQKIRNGSSAAELRARVEGKTSVDKDLQKFLNDVAAGYEAIAQGDFKSVLPQLSTTNPTESHLHTAERRYLQALCQLELQTNDGFVECRQILETWRSTLVGEPELSTRFGLLLQQAFVLLEMYDDARKIEKALELELSKRARFDKDAADTLQIQNRRSASVNSVEVATVRTSKAIEYFEAADATGSPRNPLELYRSLNNQSALLIELGKYKDAFSVASRAEQLLVAHQAQGFPRHDVLAHNLVLASYRAGELTPSAAIARQNIVVSSDVGRSDNFLQRCNLAVYMLLSGDEASSEKLLSALQKEIDSRGYHESYLRYYTKALALGAAISARNSERAHDLHDELTPFVAEIRWPTAPYIRRRHELLKLWLDGLPEELSTSIEATDCALVTAHPLEVGPCWNHHGRLFPCSELAFWSDS